MKYIKTKRFDSVLSPTSVIEDSDPTFIDDTDKVIRTDDYGLAVTLFHTGAKLLSVDKDNSGRHIFIFKKICNIEYATDEFFSDLLTVKSFSFLESIKAFKKRIDSEQNKDSNPTK